MVKILNPKIKKYFHFEFSLHLKIGVVEAIDDVPAQHEELSPLDEEGVEETEGKEELLVLVVTLAAREGRLVHHLV